MKSGKWHDPFTAEQVAALEEYQKNGVNHPYTCGTDSTHPPLVPFEDGWYCKDKWCEYRQTWAHVIPVTLKHYLLAAGLVSHTKIMEDGYPSVIVHSDEEAVKRALAAISNFELDHPPITIHINP